MWEEANPSSNVTFLSKPFERKHFLQSNLPINIRLNLTLSKSQRDISGKRKLKLTSNQT